MIVFIDEDSINCRILFLSVLFQKWYECLIPIFPISWLFPWNQKYEASSFNTQVILILGDAKIVA